MRRDRLAVAAAGSRDRTFRFRRRAVRRRLLAFLFSPLLKAIDSRLLAPGELTGRGIQKILICRLNSRLGNQLLLTPLVAALERRFPAAKIEVLAVGRAATAVFAGHEPPVTIHPLPPTAMLHPWALLRTIIRLRSRRFDLAIDPAQRSFSSRLCLRLTASRMILGLPLAGRDQGEEDEGLPPMQPVPVHAAQFPLWLLARGEGSVPGPEVQQIPLHVQLNPVEKYAGDVLFTGLASRPERRPVIGIFADATGGKRYPMAWWLELSAALLQAEPAAALIEVLAAHGRSCLRSRYPVFYSTDIREMAAVLSHFDWVISADSGVMHLAAASGANTIGLFKVTDPAVYAPYGGRSHAIDTRSRTAAQVAAEITRLLVRCRT